MAPEISDLDLETLCRRAIADPHSITRDERNTIWRLPLPEEEDRLCVEKTGHTRARLVAKALATPDDLTREEATIILDPRGVLSNAQGSTSICTPAGDAGPRSTQLEELRDQAAGALQRAAGEGEKTALLNAFNREVALNQALTEEADRHFEEWEASRRLQNGTPWIRDLVKNGLLDAECWGFVVFRTAGYRTEQDKEAWRRFREYFDTAAKATMSQFNSGPLLWPKFCPVFVEREELDGVSDEQLRIEFKRLRDGGTGANRQLPKGIRTSCFLVADRALIENDAVKIGFIVRDLLDFSLYEDDPAAYIRALQPDFQPKKELVKAESDDKPIPSHDSPEQDSGMQGFAGAVTVALPRVFDWLNCVCFESECGSAWEGTPLGNKGWYDIYTQTKVPEDWIKEFAPNAGLISYQPWSKRQW